MTSKYLSLAALTLCCISCVCVGEETWNEWRVASQSTTAIVSNHTITLIKSLGPREVWIASTEGIFLFDGAKTKRKPINWRNNSDLPLKRAIDFVKSRDGSVYLFTIEDGIFKTSPDSFQFEVVSGTDSGISIGRVDAIAISKETNTTLLLSNNRILSISLGDTTISEVVAHTQADIGPARGLLTSKDGYIYVVFDNIVVRLVWQVDRFVPQMRLYCELRIPSINTSTQTTNDDFYVSDNFGKLHHLKINNTECTRQQVPHSIREATSDSRINAVRFLGDSETLAISSDKGLLLIADHSIERISTQNSPMRSDEVIAVDEVSKGNIIIGSFVGVMHATRSPFISVTRFPFEGKPTIAAIASSNGPGVFVASKKGLYREVQHDDGISFVSFDLNRTHGSISALEVTENDVWIGFQDGRLLRCKLAEKTRSCDAGEEAQLSKSPITSISKTAALGSGVLVSTLEGKAFKVETSASNLRMSLLFDLEEDDARLLAVETTLEYAWFFDLKGVWAASLYEIEKRSPQEQGDIRLTKFANRPWSMASAGLSMFFASPSGDVSLYDETGALPEVSPALVWSESLDETVFSIELDQLNRPWVSTSSGLWLRDNGKFEVQVKTQGVNSVAADYGASHADHRGNIYFGGTGGLISIRKPESYPKDLSGEVVLTNIRLDNIYLPTTGNFTDGEWQLKIAAQTATIDFEFALDKMLWFHTARLQHKLEGFDTDWQNSGNNNVATYQNLPPGNYVFKARGADSTGVWSDNEINLPIQVLPPLWRSWWALLTYLVLALATLLYLKRVNDRYVADKERLKLAEEGSAAFARLEDDYQAQREANEVLLLRRAPSASALLDVVETALTAQLTDTGNQPALSALVSKIRTLHSLQTLTDRTTSEERTNLHTVTEEIAVRLAATNEVAGRAIISNEVCHDPVPLEHAVYLCLVIQEMLELALVGRRFEDLIDPLIFISMSAATLTENDECSYELRIEDSGIKNDDVNAFEQLLPLTFHLIESGGGELTDNYDAGNILTVKLLFFASAVL